MSIDPEIVRQVKEKTSIVDVIAQRVSLKKRGKVFIGLCPFHEEKTPSFSVNEEKRFYYCFGCHRTGDVIQFLMECERKSFRDSVESLHKGKIETSFSKSILPRFTRAASPEVNSPAPSQGKPCEAIRALYSRAKDFYQDCLLSAKGASVRSYLKDRGLKDSTIASFGVGYAPRGDCLRQFLLKEGGVTDDLLESSGLSRRNKNGAWHDFFQERIMIPITDDLQVVAFSGRALSNEVNAKYLNSPETAIFKKRNVLFGLDRARESISGLNQAIVVEGYFDVMSLHQGGVCNSVSPMGTSLSSEQAQALIAALNDGVVVINYDSDEAGRNGARKAANSILSLAPRTTAKILQINDVSDASEYLLTYSGEDYKRLLSESLEKGFSVHREAPKAQSLGTHSITLEPEPMLAQSETLLIQMCLDRPSVQGYVKRQMEKKEIEFTLLSTRLAWSTILEGMDSNEGGQDLPVPISSKVDFAISCMEMLITVKRWRYSLARWREVDPDTEPEKYKSYFIAAKAQKDRLSAFLSDECQAAIATSLGS